LYLLCCKSLVVIVAATTAVVWGSRGGAAKLNTQYLLTLEGNGRRHVY